MTIMLDHHIEPSGLDQKIDVRNKLFVNQLYSFNTHANKIADPYSKYATSEVSPLILLHCFLPREFPAHGTCLKNYITQTMSKVSKIHIRYSPNVVGYPPHHHLLKQYIGRAQMRSGWCKRINITTNSTQN